MRPVSKPHFLKNDIPCWNITKQNKKLPKLQFTNLCLVLLLLLAGSLQFATQARPQNRSRTATSRPSGILKIFARDKMHLYTKGSLYTLTESELQIFTLCSSCVEYNSSFIQANFAINMH